MIICCWKRGHSSSQHGETHCLIPGRNPLIQTWERSIASDLVDSCECLLGDLRMHNHPPSPGWKKSRRILLRSWEGRRGTWSAQNSFGRCLSSCKILLLMEYLWFPLAMQPSTSHSEQTSPTCAHSNRCQPSKETAPSQDQNWWKQQLVLLEYSSNGVSPAIHSVGFTHHSEVICQFWQLYKGDTYKLKCVRLAS